MWSRVDTRAKRSANCGKYELERIGARAIINTRSLLARKHSLGACARVHVPKTHGIYKHERVDVFKKRDIQRQGKVAAVFSASELPMQQKYRGGAYTSH